VGLVLTSLSHYNRVLRDGSHGYQVHGNRGVTTGAGGGYHWQHPATNLHMWRPGRDGRLLADPERQQHPYPTQATEQPFLGTALLSSNEERE